MTDDELTTRIQATIQERGMQGLRNLTRMPRTRYGLVVYGFDLPAQRPQNQQARRHINQYDEPDGTVTVRELSPGHRRVVFGKQWRAGKALTSRTWGGVQSGLNSIFLKA